METFPSSGSMPVTMVSWDRKKEKRMKNEEQVRASGRGREEQRKCEQGQAQHTGRGRIGMSRGKQERKPREPPSKNASSFEEITLSLLSSISLLSLLLLQVIVFVVEFLSIPSISPRRRIEPPSNSVIRGHQDNNNRDSQVYVYCIEVSFVTIDLIV